MKLFKVVGLVIVLVFILALAFLGGSGIKG
jgi:hypothetical protein